MAPSLPSLLYFFSLSLSLPDWSTQLKSSSGEKRKGRKEGTSIQNLEIEKQKFISKSRTEVPSCRPRSSGIRGTSTSPSEADDSRGRPRREWRRPTRGTKGERREKTGSTAVTSTPGDGGRDLKRSKNVNHLLFQPIESTLAPSTPAEGAAHASTLV